LEGYREKGRHHLAVLRGNELLQTSHCDSHMKRSRWANTWQGQELLGRGPWYGQDMADCHLHPAEQPGAAQPPVLAGEGAVVCDTEP